MKYIRKYYKHAILFCISFIFLFYVSFPYGVLKELISAEIVNLSGFSVRMESLSPKLPLGISASGVTLTPPGSMKSFELQKASASIGILSLLIGRLSVELSLYSKPKGRLDLDLVFPLFGALSGKDLAPYKVVLDAEEFRLDEVVSFALNSMAAGPDVNPLLQPVLKGIGFSAKLSGDLNVNLDINSPSASKGKIQLTLKDAILHLSDPSLGLPDQKFKSAKIVAAIESGVVKIDPSSQFSAEELDIGVNGRVTLKRPIQGSDMDLQIPLKLGGGLKEKFGFILDAFAGGTPKNGQTTIALKGTLSMPMSSFQ